MAKLILLDLLCINKLLTPFKGVYISHADASVFGWTL